MLPTDDASTTNRERLAKTVSIFVLSAVGLIIIAATFLIGYLIKNPGDKPGEYIGYFKDIASMLLPLLGTWIGTVLAYYFSKENFEAANKSVKDLVSIVSSEQKLKSIKVNEPGVMILFDKIKRFDFTNDADMAQKTLSDIVKKFDEFSELRLPFIDEGKAIKYCIHRSIFDKFISMKVLSAPDTKVAELTFKDFLTTDLGEIKNYINLGFAVLKEDSTLFDAKLIMDNNKYVEDIFITKNGNKQEAIIGWITNNIILEKSKV